MLSPGENYQSTDLYRTMINSKMITPTSRNEEHRFIPNHAKVGDTYDARHLDKFLNSKWGTPAGSVTKSRVTTVTAISSPRQPISTTASTSFYLKSGPRFDPGSEREYRLNYGKDFSIKESRNNINNLILRSKLDQKSLKTYCDNELSVYDKKFDPTKLEFSNQTLTVNTPQERIGQMKDIIKNQQEMTVWKNRHKDLTKKHRLHKAAFANGVLGLDNPLSEDTKLYPEEHKALMKSIQCSQMIEKRRHEQLNTWRGTSAAVEFSNRSHRKEMALPLKKIAEKNLRRSVDLEHTERWKNTSHRIFGEDPAKFSEDRAAKLRAEETKGRAFDVISGVDNKIRTERARINQL